MCLLAPLVRGGLDPLALMILQLIAVSLLVATLWLRPQLTGREAWTLVLLLALPLLYLVPLPLAWVEHLPGHAAYVDAWRIALGGQAGEQGGAQGLPAASLSVIPANSFSAWLALLVPVAVFLAVRALNEKRLMLLIYWFLGIVAAESVLGLLQFGDGADSPLYMGLTYTHFGSAVGTYTNRNHLAGLIEMALPVALALLFFTVGGTREERRGIRAKAAFLGSLRGQESLLYAALVILLLVAGVFTRSRMGIAMAMLGIVLSLVVFARRIGGSNVYGTTGTLAALALGLTVVIGLVPVLDRFSVEGVAADQRWLMFERTLIGIRHFFPFGSGPGTFQDVFPAIQTLDLGRWFINRAHNDYLEWAFEGGLPAIGLILLLLVVYAAQWWRVWSGDAWTRLRFVQVGAGIGILLLLLHELVDYNLHTPANQIFFALLAGVFFSAAAPEQVTRTPRRTPRMGEDTPPVLTSFKPPEPPPDQIKNPFLDD